MESRLPDLLSDSPRQRLHTALELLSELADIEAAPLATQITARPEASIESEQLTRVLNLLHKRFAESIRVEDLCSVGNLSPRSLHRLFVRHVGENLSDYLGRLRIGCACMLLVETDRPISVIASEAPLTGAHRIAGSQQAQSFEGMNVFFALADKDCFSAPSHQTRKVV